MLTATLQLEGRRPPTRHGLVLHVQRLRERPSAQVAERAGHEQVQRPRHGARGH